MVEGDLPLGLARLREILALFRASLQACIASFRLGTRDFASFKLNSRGSNPKTGLKPDRRDNESRNPRLLSRLSGFPMFCVRGLCTPSVMTLCTLNVMTLCMHSVMTLCTP